MIFSETRNRRRLESRQVRASNHTYVRPYTVYSAENAEGREIGGRSYSRLHRFLNLFGGRNRGEGGGGDRSFRICPIENLSDARGVPSNLSLPPSWPRFHLPFSHVNLLYPPFPLLPFPFFIFNFISLFVTLPLVSSYSVFFSLSFSFHRRPRSSIISRSQESGKERNILYSKFVATRLEMVKNSTTVGHCSPQLSKFVGKFLFQDRRE